MSENLQELPTDGVEQVGKWTEWCLWFILLPRWTVVQYEFAVVEKGNGGVARRGNRGEVTEKGR